MFKRIIQRWFYLICLSISDKGHCQCFTEKGQLARNNTPFPIFMRTRLIHPKRSFVPRHSVISPHDDTLSFCSYGLIHCMCVGTNFSTWIKHAEVVFLNHSGILYFKAHPPPATRRFSTTLHYVSSCTWGTVRFPSFVLDFARKNMKTFSQFSRNVSIG